MNYRKKSLSVTVFDAVNVPMLAPQTPSATTYGTQNQVSIKNHVNIISSIVSNVALVPMFALLIFALVHHYRAGKAVLQTEDLDAKQAIMAKQKFEARNARLEKEKQRETKTTRSSETKTSANVFWTKRCGFTCPLWRIKRKKSSLNQKRLMHKYLTPILKKQLLPPRWHVSKEELAA